MPKAASRQTIAIDIDDVLSEQNESMRRYANNKFGYNHTSADYLQQGRYSNYWGQVWGVSDEEQNQRVDEYTSSGQLTKQSILPGALRAIKNLKLRYDLIVVTARDARNVDETHQWLDRHFPSVFKDVHFVQLWESDSAAASKAAICQAVGAGYLIDDNPNHCNQAADVGVKAILFGDYGWSRSTSLHKDVVRLKDWREVLEFFGAKS